MDIYFILQIVMSSSGIFNRFSFTPPVGGGNSSQGFASSNISYDAYKDKNLKVTPNVTTTPYYSSNKNGVDTRYGVSISYNFMGGK